MQHLQATALFVSVVFATQSHEAAQPLPVKPPAVQIFRVIELNDEGSTVRFQGMCDDITFSLDVHSSLVYRAEALPTASVDSSSKKKRKASSLIATGKHLSKKGIRSSSDGEGVKAGVKRLASLNKSLS